MTADPHSHRARAKAGAAVGLTFALTVVHYALPARYEIAHLFLRELYLLPVALGALWLGLRGGLGVAALAAAAYLPLVLWLRPGPTVHAAGNALQAGVFCLFGALLGWLRDRDVRRRAAAGRQAELAAMGQAVSSIAHDMKSPLMAIGGFARQVRKDMPDGQGPAKKLDIVVSQAGRLEAMVRDMLAFARPLELSPAEVDLPALANEAAEVARQAASAQEVRVDVEAPSSLRLRADPHRLQQALLNLINNAVEASPPGGRVWVRVRRQGRGAELRVADQGPGVPAEQRRDLFEPFVTTKGDGTGLGLAITAKIARAHGGTVRLEDESPGAVFVLELPAVP